jgi:uncharacterized protein YegL
MIRSTAQFSAAHGLEEEGRVSTQPIPDVQLIDNTSQRLACALVLDCSGSMSGKPIEALNQGLRVLETELKADAIASQRVQLLVVRIGEHPTNLQPVSIVSEWTDANGFSAPTVEASGSTPLGVGVRLALQRIAEQVKKYNDAGIACNRPWVWMISDGAPTDPDWEDAARECREAVDRGKVVVFAIGTEGADHKALAKFTDRVVMLHGLKFAELFLYLSRTASVGSRSAPGAEVQAPPPTGWGTPIPA